MPKKDEAGRAKNNFCYQGTPPNLTDVRQLALKRQAENSEIRAGRRQGYNSPESSLRLSVDQTLKMFLQQSYPLPASVFPHEQHHKQRPADKGDNEKVVQELIRGVEKVGGHAFFLLGTPAGGGRDEASGLVSVAPPLRRRGLWCLCSALDGHLHGGLRPDLLMALCRRDDTNRVGSSG